MRTNADTIDKATLTPTEEMFAGVCENARLNLRDALDLVFVHAEQPVRGTQPRASLNPAIAVAAVGAWERFVSDLVGAVSPTGADPDRGWLPGAYSGDSSHHRDKVAGRLKNLGWLDQRKPSLLERWVVDVPSGWTGSKPTGWSRRGTATPELWGAEDFLEAAILVRNAGAHRANAALEQACEAKKVPFLDSDADSTTIQNGHARGILAVVVQVIDSTIAAICEDHGWSDVHRLPDAWFSGEAQRFARHRDVNFWHHRLPRAPLS